MFCPANNKTLYIVKSLYLNKVSFSSTIFKRDCLRCFYYPLQVNIHCSFVTTNKSLRTATAKGWKPLFRDGVKDIYNPNKPPVSCEDGVDAVPHNVLVTQLQNCNTVSDQIKKFCASMSLSPADVENRKEFCRSLSELFQPYFSEFKVHLFGSSINCLGFKGSDADVSIQAKFDDKAFVPKLTEPPSLEAVRNGEVSADYVAHLPPRMLLRFVRKILREGPSDISDNILMIKGRCPILRFYSSKYDLFCDMSCENNFSLRNTKLMRLICHFDERVASFIKFVRYWGKYGGFVGDIELFNSYAFSLLAVHFLQLRNPPVLPPLKEIIEISEYLVHGDISSEDLLFKDVKKFEKSKNTQTVEELLQEYFFHFLTFDYLKVLVPLTGSAIPKAEFLPSVMKKEDDTFIFSTISLQDPFRFHFNVTEGAKDIACVCFMKGLIEACKVYQDKSAWHPSAEKWGLSRLFYRTLPNEATHKDSKSLWQQDSTHILKLPAKTDISIVKKILQEYLLFECHEFLPLNEDSPVPSLILRCGVYYNTWIGRDLISATCPSSISNFLEREKWISTCISKNITTRKRRFTFSCKCFQYSSDDELNLNLIFKKPDEYAYYLTVQILVIFLKEYMPLMCKKLSL